MLKTTSLILAGCFGIGLLACGPASFENVAACKEGAAAVNALECTAEDLLDPETSCPAAWDDVAIDYSEYLDCLFGQYTCDADGNYVFEDKGCTIPTE